MKDLGDIYYIKKEDLIDLERFADRSADNLLNAIEKSKETTLPRLIYALGIRHVGEHTARILAEEFGSLDVLMKAPYERLIGIREIGPETAESIVAFFKEPHNLEVIDRLKKAGVRCKETGRKEGALSGKTFVFTGALNSFTRDVAKGLVEERGGRVTSSVSKKVDYVVVGEEPGSKYDQARRFGIKTITEEEFKRLLSIE